MPRDTRRRGESKLGAARRQYVEMRRAQGADYGTIGNEIRQMDFVRQTKQQAATIRKDTTAPHNRDGNRVKQRLMTAQDFERRYGKPPSAKDHNRR